MCVRKYTTRNYKEQVFIRGLGLIVVKGAEYFMELGFPALLIPSMGLLYMK